jgi:hypothetical protein
VFAAGKQGGQHAQIGVAELQSFRLASSGAGGAHKGAKVFAAGYVAKVVDADPGEVGNFIFGENFLGRFHCDHFPAPFSVIV